MNHNENYLKQPIVPNEIPFAAMPTTAGTAGQVLTSNGSGAPIWAAASSSSDVVVAQGSEPQSEDTLIWIDTSSN